MTFRRGLSITKDWLLFVIVVLITYEVTVSESDSAYKNPCSPEDHLCNQIFAVKLETLGLIDQLYEKFPDLAGREAVNGRGGGTAGVSEGDVQRLTNDTETAKEKPQITTKETPPPIDQSPSTTVTMESGKDVEIDETLTTVAVQSDRGTTRVSMTSHQDGDDKTSSEVSVQMTTQTATSSFADEGNEKTTAASYPASSTMRSQTQIITPSLPESTVKLSEPSETEEPEILTSHRIGDNTGSNGETSISTTTLAMKDRGSVATEIVDVSSSVSSHQSESSATKIDQSSSAVTMTTTELTFASTQSDTSDAKQTTLHLKTSTSSPSPRRNVEEYDSTGGPMFTTARPDDVTTSHTASSMRPTYSVINITGDRRLGDISPNETVVEGRWTAPYENNTTSSAYVAITDEPTESPRLHESSSRVNVRDATTRRTLESIASSPSQHPTSPTEEATTSSTIESIGSTLREVITSLMTSMADEQELSTEMESIDEVGYEIYYEGTTVEYVTDEPVATSRQVVATEYQDIATSTLAATSTEKGVTTSQSVVIKTAKDVATSQPVFATTAIDVATSQPVVVTSVEVDVATSQPVVITTEKEVATSQPVVSGTEKEVTTSQPVVSSTDVVVATSQPVVTTAAKDVATSQPVVSSTDEDVATSQPVVTTAVKDVATSQQVVTTTARGAEESTTTRPMTSTEDDVVTIKQTTTHKYVTTSQRPISTTEKAVTTSVTTTEVDVTTRPATTTLPPPPKNCHDIWLSGERQNGIYTVYPAAVPRGFEVYCNLSENDGGWTVIQRRVNGSVNFYQSYFDYMIGFGSLEREFYLGNEYIHALTSQQNYQLSIILFDDEGESRFANYRHFKVGDYSSGYRIQIKGYSGNAGNSLGHHSKSKFSTFDRDNDENRAENCARTFASGWWFKDCDLKSNLNGKYLRGEHTQRGRGITWKKWKGLEYSLKFTEMKIKPNGL